MNNINSTYQLPYDNNINTISLEIVVASNEIWHDISVYLNGVVSKNAIHVFVHRDRHNVKAALGFQKEQKLDFHSISKNANMESFNERGDSNLIDESSDYSSDDTLKKLPTKCFTFTFSTDEWKQIQPQEVVYKMNDRMKQKNSTRSYYILPKGSWTSLLAEFFWEHTKLPCCIAFKRAKVHEFGNYYITVDGRCSVCKSIFKGIISDKPSENSRVIMQCTFSGNFELEHRKIKKRRLIGPAIDKALMSIVDDKISCETYRENEAVRLMNIGDPDPPIIPSGNTLRALKSRKIASTKRHNDTITSLVIMKSENDYKNILHDMGSHPFFIHYHSGEQIHMYRKYCSSNPYPKLIIDATGSIIKNFYKFNLEKTRSIFLYEAIIYDEVNEQSTTLTNMLTERHTTISIFNWLAKWLSCNIPQPRQTVCDQSLALLSAITQCFTQYSSLQNYIQVCGDLLTDQIPNNSHWVPKCFIRIDVAHFIRLASKWPPLKLAPPRIRELILRTIGLIVKSQTLEDVHTLLLSLFVVLINETNGIDKETGFETSCEKHYNILISATTTGFVTFKDKFDEIMAFIESENDAREVLEEEYERQIEGLSEENPFKSWTEKIHEKSKSLVQEGLGINPMYLPSLIPYIVKCTKLLPLWSAIMVPIFGFGEETSSSAAVESSFQKLKNVTLNHIDLPMSIESFLEHHIKSLRGSSLLKAGQKCRSISENSDNLFINEQDNIIPDNDDIEEDVYKKCPLCSTGSLPSINGAHKCTMCKTPVHAIPSCSSHIEGDETLRICKNCSEVRNVDLNENNATETWNKKTKKKLKSNSYLLPNPHLRHLDMNARKNIKTLPLLKNGSRADELKSLKITNIDGAIILSNTCAFDAVVSLIMVAFCDSTIFSNELLQKSTVFIEFISTILKNGISSNTYTQRAALIADRLNPTLEILQNDVTLLICDTTVVEVIKAMLVEFPSVIETVNCSNKECEKHHPYQRSVSYITFQTKNGQLQELQEFLIDRIRTEKLVCGLSKSPESTRCNGLQTIEPTISPVHILIEIIFWKGENIEHSNDAGCTMDIKLCDIPQVLNMNSISYELRGVIHFRRGRSLLRNTVGHYTAYVKRCGKNWELFDDLKKKPIPVKETTKVSCELLLYTI